MNTPAASPTPLDASLPAPGPATRGDRLGGPLWVVVGLAVVTAAWRTDRMSQQGVPWFGAPGLVPGLLGVAIVVLGLLLSLRARRAGSAGGSISMSCSVTMRGSAATPAANSPIWW